jgi:hypothetical protein
MKNVKNPSRRRLVQTAGAAAVVMLMAAFPVAAQSPFERTEDREECLNYDWLKQPFFGETHLHSAYSFDASTLDTRNTPAKAYHYAQGGKVGLPPWADTRTIKVDQTNNVVRDLAEFPYCFPGDECQFTATRTAQLPPGRALDFAAVTDHSEQLGENNICLFVGTEQCGPPGGEPGSCSTGQSCSLSGVCVPDGWKSSLCTAVRDEASRTRTGRATSIVLGQTWFIETPRHPPNICGPEGNTTCEDNAKTVWDQIQDDAEAAYDRTSACKFTSFIAYEYTAMAANGRCADTLLPCWAHADCPGPGPQICEGIPGSAIPFFVGLAGGDNLHRNIIFRNKNTVIRPISNVDQPLECGAGLLCDFADNNGPVASPETMLSTLASECNPAGGEYCEFISIPHNPNLSRGSMFVTPVTNAEAQIRQDYEPLVEIMQIKGQSECRFQEETGRYWSSNVLDTKDELCAFENMNFIRLTGNYIPTELLNKDTIPPRSYVRETLKNGILYQSEHDVNPFQLGFVGGLDNHNATPGQANEAEYAKIGAHGIISFADSAEALNEKFFLGLQTNAGGLTVAWAEENSRDSIFTAMQNRETYATSGTRPIVRFFGGFGLPKNICQRGNFAEQGYAFGVPMGGMLTGAPSSGAPEFAVSALWDPGWTGQKGTELQRIQIVKGWIDDSGESHEKVFDVAGTASDAGVNLKTCEPNGHGHKDLCAVWTDRDFDKDEHAFYYVRVLENSSCRWNQHYCNARGVDCTKSAGTCRTESKTDTLNGQGCFSNDDCGDGICVLPASYTTWEDQQCCSDIVPKTVQQRAWTSPIWYTPAAE